MSNFPSLQPSSRIFTPGQHSSTPMSVLTGDENSVRHSNSSTGHALRMTFKALTETQLFSIIGHYSLHGSFQSFELPAVVLTATTVSVPTGYLWRYIESPEITKSATSIDVAVALDLVPPYVI